jgi:DNA-binding NarL/FixJ family response regulator
MNQRFFRLGSSRSESRHIAILSGTIKELPVYLPTQIQREHILGSKEIRCLLVHDHVLLRQGLRRLLEDQPDIEVVAEAGNAAEALDRVFEHRPEVVITDPHIFECTADQAERLILKECPHSKVLFLMTHERENTLQDSQSEGTSCAVRHTSAQELVEMVRRTHSGQETTVQEIPERRRGEWLPRELHPRKRILTTREREVLKLLAEGRTVRSAAVILGLSVKTVDAHKFNLMRKLGIHNKAELVMWAIQRKVVKVPANY